jgi:DNA polymerase I-like protein with 3'-5' exonuclease and polymerase domains
MTKAAMLQVYDKMGLVPHMQVHDELNYSVESLDQAQEIQWHMEHCVDITVPMLADLDYGDTWK